MDFTIDPDGLRIGENLARIEPIRPEIRQRQPQRDSGDQEQPPAHPDGTPAEEEEEEPEPGQHHWEA